MSLSFVYQLGLRCAARDEAIEIEQRPSQGLSDGALPAVLSRHAEQRRALRWREREAQHLRHLAGIELADVPARQRAANLLTAISARAAM